MDPKKRNPIKKIKTPTINLNVFFIQEPSSKKSKYDNR
jgi:hypothetical protein